MKEKPKKLWFKAKCYGWGWYPSSWEGWLVTLGFVSFITLMANIFLTKGKIIEYAISLAILTGVIIYLGHKKGEKPKWRWGR
jgi:hypothetical protein